MDDKEVGNPTASLAVETRTYSQARHTDLCRRCGHIFKYNSKIEWHDLERMIIDHWKICPNNIRAAVIRENRMSVDTPTAVDGGSRSLSAEGERCRGGGDARSTPEGGAPSAPVSKRHASLTLVGKRSLMSTSVGKKSVQLAAVGKKKAPFMPVDEGGAPSVPVGGCKRERRPVMAEAARIKMLKGDEWATDVEPTSVKCRGCGRVVMLDKRSRYYPGLWIKHRNKCVEIKRLIAIGETKAAGRR